MVVRVGKSVGGSGRLDKGHHEHASSDIVLAFQGFPSEGGRVVIMVSGSHCMKRRAVTLL